MLAKILQGSREKKLLQQKLDLCPVYGYFKGMKLDHVLRKFDWMIDYDFLDIEYSRKWPMIFLQKAGQQFYKQKGFVEPKKRYEDIWLD